MNTNPSTLCPQFIRCSVNNCPLEPSYPNAFIHPDDSQKSCPMEKPVRLRIAAQFPPATLTHGGLTTREATAKARWDALSLDVKTKMVNEGKDRLERLRKDKARKISP